MTVVSSENTNQIMDNILIGKNEFEWRRNCRGRYNNVNRNGQIAHTRFRTN